MPEGNVKVTRRSNNAIVVTPNLKESQPAPSTNKACKRPLNDSDSDEDVRGGKQRKRLKWTTDLQEKFLKAVNKLGLFHGAVPSAILKEMGPCPGLTRENVASHLQLYRAQVVKDMLNSIDTPACAGVPLMKSSATHCRRELIQAKEKEKQVLHPGCQHPVQHPHHYPPHPHYHHPHYAYPPPPAYCANGCAHDEHDLPPMIHPNMAPHPHHHIHSDSEERLVLEFLEPSFEQWA